MTEQKRIVVIGAGIGGLTTGALLAKSGYQVTILEAQTYPGGSAGTFFHKGYRFDAGATVAGGFQPNGPHALAGEMLELDWKVKQHDPAWVVHLPDRSIELCQDNQDVLTKFPGTEKFWQQQQRIADLAWHMSAQGLPFPPRSIAEFVQLVKVGLMNFPADLQVIPFAFSTVYQWLKRNNLADDPAFVRFLNATLLISAQTTSEYVNALYGATAMDLPRQGVYHTEGGMGGIAEQLAAHAEKLGVEIRYRQFVKRINIENDCVTGVYATQGRRSQRETFIPADFVVANVTPWSLNELLDEDSPAGLQREVRRRDATQGAFIMHIGLDNEKLPSDIAEHHQIVRDMHGQMGEGRTLFISLSPEWDTSRALEGKRAVTVSTHTEIGQWWELLNSDHDAYDARKQQYADDAISAIDNVIPGFKNAATLVLPGTPVTFEFYTLRQQGMVGGFPQTSLFKARSPRTGIRNLRLVGDSVFPGQSTAGVTLGAIRVANDVKRSMPSAQSKSYSIPTTERQPS
ncbi:MAG: FAD-dependent oxidoreductase [Aggregatilineales bacterium]